MSFTEEVKRARSKTTAQRAETSFMNMLQPQDRNVIKAGQYGERITRDNIGAIKADLSGTGFKDFVAAGYDSEDGYSIRINPNTGQKEMFVAGTRHGSQWALNALDTVLYGADKVLSSGVNLAEKALFEELLGEEPEEAPLPVNLKLLSRIDIPRHKKEKFFEKIARDNGVEVIYGHSRGGAMIADMDIPNVEKVGLDAAMLIARNSDTLNISEGGGLNPLGLFDEIIGLTGKDNVHYDASAFSPHRVWNVNDP